MYIAELQFAPLAAPPARMTPLSLQQLVPPAVATMLKSRIPQLASPPARVSHVTLTTEPFQIRWRNMMRRRRGWRYTITDCIVL